MCETKWNAPLHYRNMVRFTSATRTLRVRLAPALAALGGEHLLHLADPGDELFDVAGLVVEVETGAGAGGHAEQAVQGLRAVVPRADGDAEAVVEHLGELVCVDLVEGETHKARTMYWPWAENAQALDFAECFVSLPDERLFVPVDGVESNVVEIVDGGGHADGGGDRRRASLELGGEGRWGETI